MGLFDFYKKKEEQHYKLSLNELKEAITILSDISYTFLSSEVLMALDGRNEIMKSRIFSYAGIMGFLYEVECCYGKMADIVDSNILSHYQLVKSAMLDESHKKKTIEELADNWSDVLQVICNLQQSPNEAGKKFKAMESDIQKVTTIFERLSDKKCRKPVLPMPKTTVEDKYTKMVKTATFNPFKITCEPSLQNTQQLPNLKNVFRQELNNLCSQLGTQDYVAQKEILSGYTFNLVESYYNNAGYVPINSLNQILEQVYEAMQQTGFRNAYSSLDDFKCQCYYGYLNQ